jgi:hypothetical protein
MDLKIAQVEDVDWIDPAQHRDHRALLVKRVLNLQVP